MLDTKRHRLNRPTTYLSVGSNLDHRESNVLRAIRAVDAEIAPVLRVSSLYETEPVGCPPMPDFVNAVAEVQTLLPPKDLLKRLQALEKCLGRSHGGHNEPRVLDIDIIAIGGRLIQTDELIVPHPRYRQRRFVLEPLREIAPEFRCPACGELVTSMLARLGPGQQVVRVSGRRVVERGDTVQSRSYYVFSDQAEVDR